MPKAIQISRQSTVWIPHLQSYKLVVEAINPEDMPSEVFIKQRLKNFAQDSFDDNFVAVCTPVQLEDLPVNAPDAGSSFYRVSKIELVGRLPEAIDKVFDSLIYEIQKLVDDLNSLDYLNEAKIYDISAGSTEVIPGPVPEPLVSNKVRIGSNGYLEALVVNDWRPAAVTVYVNNFGSLPGSGNINLLYVIRDTNEIYRWNSETNQYVNVSANPDVQYPVTSVNTKTGAVVLNNVDVGAAATTHTHQIGDVANLQTALDGKQAAGNYVTLQDGKVPAAQLPSYVDDVVEFDDLASFDAEGETGKIYVSKDTGKTYRWSGSTYIEISAGPGSTDSVAEGATNLYFTPERALDAVEPNLNLKANLTDIYNSAVDWTVNHTLADGTRYLVGDLVYSGGKIYKANYENESMPVTSSLYWTDLGPGYRLNIDGRDIPNIPVSPAIQTALNGKANTVHTHAASEISDATSVGRTLLTAATAQAQRTALDIFVAAASLSAIQTQHPTGNLQRVYLAQDTGKIYIWNGTGYSEIGGTNNYPAFTAYINRETPYDVNSGTVLGEIVYTHAAVNKGNHMNISTGRFTAPYSGTYHFSFTGQSQNAFAPSYCGVHICKNGQALDPDVRCWTSQYQVDLAPGYPAHETLALTVNLALQQGDYVSMYLNTGRLAGNSGAVFSGHLIG